MSPVVRRARPAARLSASATALAWSPAASAPRTSSTAAFRVSHPATEHGQPQMLFQVLDVGVELQLGAGHDLLSIALLS